MINEDSIELKQKDIDNLIAEMEKISPKVKELVQFIKELPKKYQEIALTKLYSKTQEWKNDKSFRKKLRHERRKGNDN